MKLTAAQLQEFNDNGFLVVRDIFTAEEVDALRAESVAIFEHERSEVWREKNGAPRTAFGCHEYNELFRSLTRDSRLVIPVEQIIGEKLYIHQFKVNPKVAFDGDPFPWHQDFVTWHYDDGMPEPRGMNIAIMLDDVTPNNGALMFVPGSHGEGMIEAPDVNGRRWMERRDVARLIKKSSDIVAASGKAGDVLMFHGNTVHGSAGNITPLPRRILYVTYNAVSNYLREPKRASFIAHRTFEPVDTVVGQVLHAVS
ncbi:ectoine hydroxylase [Modicisalibacter muralis]|uniref:Ectoine hydroxylase n=1 Tax=Modicisalibacter muralis TaxID=119000 RepID=A0A1G9M733_9GAMM|nr:phytanoyl-CoA dioxygenase family protein [Halomonas muralis]SDL69923.1 ectoine hydroxylase [Halomonas muralis]